MNTIYRTALMNALATVLYVIVIASFLSFVPQSVGIDESSSLFILVPVMMLLLLVTSAAITGFLVFGRPVMWYLDGRKPDALRLLGATIGFLSLAVLTTLAFMVLATQ